MMDLESFSVPYQMDPADGHIGDGAHSIGETKLHYRKIRGRIDELSDGLMNMKNGVIVSEVRFSSHRMKKDILT